MNIKPISKLLHDHGFEYPQLAALQPSDALYTALLVQPTASIQVRDDFIRNTDRVGSQSMFGSIAREAHVRSVELFITPEYSFPWDTIEDLLHGGIGPAEGQLWVLGCESLSLDDLPALKDRFSKWAVVLHESLPENQPATARYLDPLVYLFRTKRSGLQETRLVMVVQFKTCPSGDPHNTEATRMDNDIQWTRIVELDLVPHPRLGRPEIIRMDYGMRAGSIRMRVRAAVAGYMLLRWSVDASPDHSLKEEQYRLWLSDPLALYGVENAKLAPGYRPPAAQTSRK